MFIRMHNQVKCEGGDIAKLTPEQAKQVQRAIERIVKGNTKLEDIRPQTWRENCFRWKPAAAVRHCCDCEVRMVYDLKDDTMTILAIGLRDDIYLTARQRV